MAALPGLPRANYREEGPMSIRIKAWEKWQGACISRVKRNRKWRNESAAHPNSDVNGPFSMQSVSVSTSFDADFVRFLAEFPRRSGEAFWLRTLQYAGLHGAMFGTIDVDRRLFGPIVLSRPWDVVSRALGAKVYDALLAHGLCSDDGDEYRAEAYRKASAEASPEASPEALTLRARARSRPVPSRPGRTEGRRSRGDGSGSTKGRAAAPPGRAISAEDAESIRHVREAKKNGRDDLARYWANRLRAHGFSDDEIRKLVEALPDDDETGAGAA